MKTPAFTSTCFSILFLGCSSLAAQEQARQHPLLENEFSLSLGAFVTDRKIRLRVDGEIRGDTIDLGRKWGMNSDQTSGAGEFRWQFGEKWSVAGQYFGSSDTAKASLSEDVHWKDWVLEKGSHVGAGFELDIARLFFGRKVHEGPNHELEVGAGLHWIEIGAFIKGEAIVNGESTGLRKDSVSAGAPLPNLGVSYRYVMSPRWLLNARADWLDVSLDDYSGGFWNAAVGVNYQLSDHFGLGLAYQAFGLDGDVKNSQWDGSVTLVYRGPFLSLTSTW